MGTLRTYTLGFILSIGLTLCAFGLVDWYLAKDFPSYGAALITLVVLAIAQLFVQVIFFLHLERERGGRWNFIAFVFALLVVAIVVSGTLWIMNHLNHMQMTPEEMFEEEAIHHLN